MTGYLKQREDAESSTWELEEQRRVRENSSALQALAAQLQFSDGRRSVSAEVTHESWRGVEFRLHVQLRSDATAEFNWRVPTERLRRDRGYVDRIAREARAVLQHPDWALPS